MRFIHMIPLFGVLLLTGCACMDLSMLDTAVPIKANTLQVMGYNTMSWDVFKVAGVTPDTMHYNTSTHGGVVSHKSSELIKPGLQINVGLGKGMEFGTKFTPALSNKSYLKIRFYHPNDHISLAVEPTFGYQHDTDNNPDLFTLFSKYFAYEFRSCNYELPVIFTLATGSHDSLMVSCIGRLSYDRTNIHYWMGSEKRGTDHYFNNLDVWRLGFYFNLQINDAICTSVGFEITPLNSSRAKGLPVLSVGLKYFGRHSYE